MKRVIVLVILILCISCSMCVAQSEMQIELNKNVIEKDEELEVSVSIKNAFIATFTIEMYWDNTKLQYIKGPENSNAVNNRILYTWVSQTGQDVSEIDIGNFVFKGIEKGKTSFVITGEFYNANGEKVEIGNSNVELQVGKVEKEIIENEKTDISDDNAYLKVLRLNHEGISPDFNKNVKEYYFVADETINNLDVTAIPENELASVIITGNNNFKIGSNIINIEVQSKDKTNVEVYKIYVTKTKNVEMANANLENLAVRQAMLTPPFDFNITKYFIEIANDVDKLDILAVPQNQKASVKISGNSDIKVGDNRIEVVVSASDGITIKKYEIIAHRRNEVEELQKQEEQKVQAQKLSTILEQTQSETQNNENLIVQENNYIFIIGGLMVLGAIIIILIIIKNKKSKKIKY